MDNRGIAAERFIDERQYEAMRAVSRARLQREAIEGAGVDDRRRGWLGRLRGAFRRTWSPAQTQESHRVPVRVEIRK